jgi:hypothetical protein
MELVEKLILVIVLSLVKLEFCFCGTTVTLNGPAIQTEDLRAIDGYVSQGLPLFAASKGFVLHSGMRPVIVKVKDPNKVIRDGIEQPNPSYYRDLPSVIPQGYEGIASTSFHLGHPLGPHPVFHQEPQQQRPLEQFNPIQIQQQENNNLPTYQFQQQQQPQQYIQQQPQQYAQQQFFPQQQQQQEAESSIRVENRIQAQQQQQYSTNSVDGGDDKLTTNPVVVQTSAFEANLPSNLQNPFYSNQMLAHTLARESLPVPGE